MNAASFCSSLGVSASASGTIRRQPCACNLRHTAPGRPWIARRPIGLRRDWGLQHRSAASAGDYLGTVHHIPGSRRADRQYLGCLMHGKALEYQPWHIGYSCLEFFTIGELSAADLPPEGDGEQDSGFDISIDVFPRLHERDPYRQGYLIPLSPQHQDRTLVVAYCA